jgi:hypothetical protein
VLDVRTAKEIARAWLQEIHLDKAVAFGLPEVDDRYHVWRVPLTNQAGGDRLGEIVIDARSSLVLENKTTLPAVLEARLLGRNGVDEARPQQNNRNGERYILSSLRNTIACGDSEEILPDLPASSIDLVFTSPPYYNARPEYTDFVDYEEYLLKLRKVIQNAHRVPAEGRFFVMNISPVLIRRSSRNEASQ